MYYYCIIFLSDARLFFFFSPSVARCENSLTLLIEVNSLGIVFGKRANASNLFLARNSCFAVTKTAYGIVGSVRIGMVY